MSVGRLQSFDGDLNKNAEKLEKLKSQITHLHQKSVETIDTAVEILKSSTSKIGDESATLKDHKVDKRFIGKVSRTLNKLKGKLSRYDPKQIEAQIQDLELHLNPFTEKGELLTPKEKIRLANKLTSLKNLQNKNAEHLLRTSVEKEIKTLENLKKKLSKYDPKQVEKQIQDLESRLTSVTKEGKSLTPKERNKLVNELTSLRNLQNKNAEHIIKLTSELVSEKTPERAAFGILHREIGRKQTKLAYKINRVARKLAEESSGDQRVRNLAEKITTTQISDPENVSINKIENTLSRLGNLLTEKNVAKSMAKIELEQSRVAHKEIVEKANAEPLKAIQNLKEQANRSQYLMYKFVTRDGTKEAFKDYFSGQKTKTLLEDAKSLNTIKDTNRATQSKIEDFKAQITFFSSIAKLLPFSKLNSKNRQQSVNQLTEKGAQMEKLGLEAQQRLEEVKKKIDGPEIFDLKKQIVETKHKLVLAEAKLQRYQETPASYELEDSVTQIKKEIEKYEKELTQKKSIQEQEISQKTPQEAKKYNDVLKELKKEKELIEFQVKGYKKQTENYQKFASEVEAGKTLPTLKFLRTQMKKAKSDLKAQEQLYRGGKEVEKQIEGDLAVHNEVIEIQERWSRVWGFRGPRYPFKDPSKNATLEEVQEWHTEVQEQIVKDRALLEKIGITEF